MTEHKPVKQEVRRKGDVWHIWICATCKVRYPCLQAHLLTAGGMVDRSEELERAKANEAHA